MGILAAIGKWFASTKVGRWLIGLGAVALAALALAYTAFLKGKHAQAGEDAAKDAQEQADAVKVAADTYRQASDAAAKVEADAAKQPAPDPIKRDDFNGTF